MSPSDVSWTSSGRDKMFNNFPVEISTPRKMTCRWQSYNRMSQCLPFFALCFKQCSHLLIEIPIKLTVWVTGTNWITQVCSIFQAVVNINAKYSTSWLCKCKFLMFRTCFKWTLINHGSFFDDVCWLTFLFWFVCWFFFFILMKDIKGNVN